MTVDKLTRCNDSSKNDNKSNDSRHNDMLPFWGIS